VPKKIITVGVAVPSEDEFFTSIASNLSLLDYDIAIINPNISGLYGYSYEDYQGKPCLSNSNSFKLKEYVDHWRREITEAVKAGKTVFLLLNKIQEVFVATGEESYSGTGHNRQTTRHVDLYSNYRIVPGGISVTNSNGSSMKLTGDNNPLTAYWGEMSGLSVFHVFVESEQVSPLVVTRSGGKIVGGYLRYKNAPGALVLLPYIDFDREEFEEEKEDELYWTDEALQLGKQFIKVIVSVDKILRQEGEVTPMPPWGEQDKYVLPKEGVIRNKLVKNAIKHDKLQQEKEDLEQALVGEITFKALLYEKGKNLETAVHEALKYMGFDTSRYRENDSEFDVVFESKEGRLIGEVEGKDNKPINIGKLRQLAMNLHEDLEREEVNELAKGVLIGNAYRLMNPVERDDFFTKKCMLAAVRSETALIRSVDLFSIARYLSGKRDSEFAKKCRQAIVDTSGVVVFPEIPEIPGKKKEKVVVDSVD
jgi:hypothetical protein